MLELSPYQFDDRLFFVGAALLLNWIIGGPPALLRLFKLDAPGAFLTKQLISLEKRLNRSTRSNSDRILRGSIVLLLAILLIGNVAMAISALTAVHQLGWLAEVVLIALFTPQRRLWEEGRRVYHLMFKKQDVDAARKKITTLTKRDAHNLDEAAIMRATAEYTTSGLADQVLAPLCWYVLLGLPGFVACKIIRLAALLQGYDSKRHQAYGRFAGSAARVLNAIPAQLAGLFLVLAALFTPKGNPARALSTLLRDARKVTPPLCGAPVAAAAGALNIALAGPRSVQGFLVKDEWVGKGSAKITLATLKKILLLYVIACLLILAAIATVLAALA